MALPAAPIIVYVGTVTGCLTTGVGSCFSCVASWRSANAAVRALELSIDKSKIDNLEAIAKTLDGLIDSLLKTLPGDEGGDKQASRYRSRLSDAATDLATRVRRAAWLPSPKEAQEARFSAFDAHVEALIGINQELAGVLDAAAGGGDLSAAGERVTRRQPEPSGGLMQYGEILHGISVEFNSVSPSLIALDMLDSFAILAIL